MFRSALVFAAFASLTFSLPAAAKLYKWVDDQGVTHYGETIPPEYAGKDRSELNQTGRVVNTKDVLTPEELSAQRAAQAQADAEKRERAKAKLEADRRDKMLVSTYSSSAEIDLARKRNLQQIELRINGINSQIKIVGDNLAGLQKEADGYEQKKRPVPASLQEDIKETEVRLEKLQKDLEKPTAEKAALNARYDADKERYHQLTGK
ncbi:MAG TPA: DUF4124 domain-containing protein [Gallionella sp.]